MSSVGSHGTRAQPAAVWSERSKERARQTEGLGTGYKPVLPGTGRKFRPAPEQAQRCRRFYPYSTQECRTSGDLLCLLLTQARVILLADFAGCISSIMKWNDYRLGSFAHPRRDSDSDFGED